MPFTAAHVRVLLASRARADKAEFLPKFFQAYPGGYGEGDQFLGVVVPDQRQIARENRELPLEQLDLLITNKFHECRLTAIFILAEQFRRAKDPALKKLFVHWLLDRTRWINNWDLVDSCGPQIIGEHALSIRNHRLLLRLSKSQDLWEQRLSIVSNLPLIKHAEFEPILLIAEKFLGHPHDLIHKSTGWMLREVGKQQRHVLIGFLESYSHQMPRTMLRYSIEKFPDSLRKKYMQRG